MHVTLSLFDHARSNRASRATVDFGEFLDDFRSPSLSNLEPSPESARTIKLNAPAFAPATFKDDRRKKAHIEQAQVLAYDIDEDVDARELSERLRRRGISFAIHHTTSAGFSVSSTGRGSVHVLIPLARAVDAETYLRYWDEAKQIFYGIEVDMSKRGAESLFFAPTIFEAHANGYYFDAVTDAPFLGSSGFRPLRPQLDGIERYVNEVQTCDDKHTTLNRISFTLGLLGLELEDVKTRLLEALKDNVVSTPVSDWTAAENTIVSAWTDGNAQKTVEDSRPKYIPEQAKSTANRILKASIASILKGETLNACAFRVGQFIPHVLEYSETLNELQGAWERAKNHDTRSLDEAVRELVAGLDSGKRKPLGIHDEWKRDLKLTPDGLGFHSGENNVHLCLEKHPDLTGLVAFDVREGAPVYLSEPPWLKGTKLTYPRRLIDSDKQKLARWVRDELDVVNVKPSAALEGLIDLADSNPHDALLTYFGSLAKATSTDVIESVLIRVLGAEDSEYTRTVTKKWLIGLVARQFVPGCKMDTVLILHGDQGLGKSTFLREIFPTELQNTAFTDSLDMLRVDKDQLIKLGRYACVEMGELAGLKKADVETVKMLVSQQTSDVRASYARLHAQYPRRAVFAGSTNRDEFLRDPTGARRFWPVTVTRQLDLEALRGLRSLLWGEAVGAYLRGVSWHLGASEEALASQVRESHEEEDAVTEKVRELLGKWPLDSKFDDPAYRMADWQLDGERVLHARLGQLLLKLGVELTNKTVERRVADCLRRLGWSTGTRTVNQVVYRVWSPKKSK
jgi:predicted P-loop ATPase